MSRPRLTLIVSNDPSCAEAAMAPAQSSWSKQLDPYRLKSEASELWSSYFRARFNSPREVALFCDVSFQTALNWWGAVTSPASHIALLMLLTDPGSADFFHSEVGRAA